MRARRARASSLPLNKSDLGIYLAVTAAAAVVFTIGLMFLGAHCTGDPTALQVCTTGYSLPQLLLGTVILEGAGLVAVALKRHEGPAWFGFVKVPVRPAMVLIAKGIVLIAVMDLATVWLGHYIKFFRESEYGLTPSAGVYTIRVFALFAVLVAPVLEEFLFRGIYFRAIWSKTGPLLAAGLSSLIFTLAHGVSGATLPIFVIGLYLCYMYKQTGSIIPGMWLHGLNNLFAVTLLMLGVK